MNKLNCDGNSLFSTFSPKFGKLFGEVSFRQSGFSAKWLFGEVVFRKVSCIACFCLYVYTIKVRVYCHKSDCPLQLSVSIIGFFNPFDIKR